MKIILHEQNLLNIHDVLAYLFTKVPHNDYMHWLIFRGTDLGFFLSIVH